MSVYLTLGKNGQGDLINITTQKSGLTELTCPFCECSLIAVRGKQKAHHFRHNGETCNESLTEVPAIEGWHHFHLNYPLEDVHALRQHYQPNSKNPLYIHDGPRYHWNNIGLLTVSDWTQHYELSEVGQIIVGHLSLSKFATWMRNTLQTRYIELKDDVNYHRKHKTWLYIEASRQQILLTSTLYLFEFITEQGDRIFKVGRTERDLNIRLTETLQDVQNALQQSVTGRILRYVPNAGYIEQFIFHKYQRFFFPLNQHKEYLALDNQAEKRLKTEFTKLANSAIPFNKNELFITTGRWKYEEKRIEAVKRGIKLTIENDGKFGRPKGSTLGTEKFLAKHQDVVNALQEGMSLNQTAEFTGKSRSTVKRVKAIL